MTVFAKLAKRLLIKGDQRTGWEPAFSATEPADLVRELDFEFEITDAGNEDFLLLCASTDGMIYGDTWHETLQAAIDVAQLKFGIDPAEWELLSRLPRPEPDR